jgi:hypothetical protein
LRPVYITVALSIFSFCCGQSFPFHEIKLQSAYTGANPYLELLGITDKDALIIKAAINAKSNSEEGSYVAFLSNGEIQWYGIFSIKDETVVKHVSIGSLAEKQSLCNQLQIANRLNQSQLNLKKIVRNEVSAQVYINDADTYYLLPDTIQRQQIFTFSVRGTP